MDETSFFLSDRWSNWRTRGSVIPQSVHLPCRRLYRSTNALLRSRWDLFCATRVWLLDEYHDADLRAEQLLQDDCRPSDLRLFLENSVSGFMVSQPGQRFMDVNIAVIDRI